MVLVMRDGEGLKVQGPTASFKLAEYMVDQGFVAGSEEDCKNQFEDPDTLPASDDSDDDDDDSDSDDEDGEGEDGDDDQPADR